MSYIPLCFVWTLQSMWNQSVRGVREYSNKMYHMPMCNINQVWFFFPEFMNEDERNLYEKLSEMFREEDAFTVIDLPGNGYWTFGKKKHNRFNISVVSPRHEQDQTEYFLLGLFSWENKPSSLTSLSSRISGKISTMFQILLRIV